MTEFIGFPRPDGSVGIRNHVLLLGLDQAGVNLCHKVAVVVNDTLLVFAGPDSGDVLSEVVRHPNVAGSVVIGEGMGEPDKENLISDLERSGKPHGVIDTGGLGFMDALTKATKIAIHMVQDVSTHRRELVRFSELLPVLLHAPDDLTTEVFVGFLKHLMEENGRCLWVEKGAKSEKVMNPEIQKALAGEVGMGQAPGADPGVYRITGPISDRGILETALASGAQLMAFLAGTRRFLANALIPGLSFTIGQDLGSDQICDLDLGPKVDKEISPEETGLLLFSEILATASGKLTRDEVLGDVLIV